ncbi:hypothetical protein [Paenibacillus sp. D2_2]
MLKKSLLILSGLAGAWFGYTATGLAGVFRNRFAPGLLTCR